MPIHMMTCMCRKAHDLDLSARPCLDACCTGYQACHGILLQRHAARISLARKMQYMMHVLQSARATSLMVNVPYRNECGHLCRYTFPTTLKSRSGHYIDTAMVKAAVEIVSISR